ncbi:MAG TPA: class I SAM-dependent methyltransferase [Candidatus Thermoplasmatota archaeon]|nr:class I SAM-dependent methyltransferase [Candidatus Thermoplasmatota archaeon]
MNDSPVIRTEAVVTCILCGTPGHPRHAGLVDRWFGCPGEWSIAECLNPACRLLWLDPRPIEADIGKAYRQYFTHGDLPSNGQPSRPSALKRFAKRALGFESDPVRAMALAQIAPGNLLDVGCGDGALIQMFERRGWNCVGIEVDAVAVRQARANTGATILHGTLSSVSGQLGSYDMVVSAHVIEHIHDPSLFFRQIWGVTHPGGLLRLVCPNGSSISHAVYGASWMPLDPPRHLYTFRPDHLGAMATAAGFQVERVKTLSRQALFMATLSRRVRDQQSQIDYAVVPSLSDKMAAALIAAVGRASGRGDEILLCARRPRN